MKSVYQLPMLKLVQINATDKSFLTRVMIKLPRVSNARNIVPINAWILDTSWYNKNEFIIPDNQILQRVVTKSTPSTFVFCYSQSAQTRLERLGNRSLSSKILPITWIQSLSWLLTRSHISFPILVFDSFLDNHYFSSFPNMKIENICNFVFKIFFYF